jgi:hypothetical protein
MMNTFARRVCVLALSFTCAACATTAGPPVKVVEKAVPTPVPCVSHATPKPGEYPDTDAALKAAAGAADRYVLIAAGRLLRIQRLAELEPVVAACRKAPAG